MDSSRIGYLFQRFEDEVITTEEREEFYALLRSFDDNDVMLEWLELSYKGTGKAEINTEDWKAVLEKILETDRPQKTIIRKMGWLKWVAAASVILAVSLIMVLYVDKNKHDLNPPVTKASDVAAPVETRAVITLANGEKIYLDSAGNGILAQENNVDVRKNATGQIVYEARAWQANGEIQYNTLFNPRGSKVVSIILNDGTKVWLNSESSLKYPTQFVSNTREVEITGEAYFEVAHNAAKPFHVKKGTTDITVLGTHFNVNAYNDEDAVRVTLLEGSVKVSNGSPNHQITESQTLKPGEQAVAKNVRLSGDEAELLTIRSVNLDVVMAWKNGRFHFEGNNIHTIMRQLQRWYDVQIEYKDTINYSFVAKISRDVPVSELLKLLELTNLVHFKIEGKKIIVMK